MRDHIIERSIKSAWHIIRTGDTVRDTAKVVGVSKSTVFLDVTDRLEIIHPALHQQVQVVLEHNKAERHIRGGEATKRMYSRQGGV